MGRKQSAARPQQRCSDRRPRRLLRCPQKRRRDCGLGKPALEDGFEPPSRRRYVNRSWWQREHNARLALESDGGSGRLGAETTSGDRMPAANLANAIAIAAGNNHSLALIKDGVPPRLGLQPGRPSHRRRDAKNTGFEWQGSPIQWRSHYQHRSQCAGQEYSLALTRQGSVLAWGNKRFFREPPKDLTNAIAIAAGDDFCLATVAGPPEHPRR